MAPSGTKVVAHIDTKDRTTWELNEAVGLYMEPSMDHYRYMEVYFWYTRATRTCKPVTFFPHSILFPQVNLNNYLKQAAVAIIQLLTTPPSTTTPSL